MKYISLGLTNVAKPGIKTFPFHYESIFDWIFDGVWTPSQTTFHILNILLHEGIEPALEFMTTHLEHFQQLQPGKFTSISSIYSDSTTFYMNESTGLGIQSYYHVNTEYCKDKLRKHFQKFLNVIHSKESITYFYVDEANYSLNGVEYTEDATENLLQIFRLLKPLHDDLQIVYFCLEDRVKVNGLLQYVSLGKGGVVENYFHEQFVELL